MKHPSHRTGLPGTTDEFSYADQLAADGHRRPADHFDLRDRRPSPAPFAMDAGELARPASAPPAGFWRRLGRRLAR